MKTFLFSFCLMMLAGSSLAVAQETLHGSWRLVTLNNSSLEQEERVVIYSDTYFMFGQYKTDGAFTKAAGGTYTMEDSSTYRQRYEFHTEDSLLVGETEEYAVRMEGGQLILDGKENLRLERIDQEVTPLNGAWRFSARVDEDGQPGERRVPGPRKTMKVLAGGRFQWAAFNTETRRFMGTGGGTFELADNTYTENILFFSRDDDKVGISLEFQFKIEGDDWFHKGHGTTGKPVYEVWERVDGGME